MSNEHRDEKPAGRTALPGMRSCGAERPSDQQSNLRKLHLCPKCGCDLVHPVSWSEAPGRSWELELRCPNCFWGETAVYDNARVEALEDHLDQALASMLEDLQRLAQANMSEQIERFARALHCDAILPEDFDF
jgi:hypothetical protein